jgi:Protein kinase domain
VVFGTPGYMSPEQAEGKPAGPASDMFALGCVTAYAAMGAGPFGTGTVAAVLYRVVHAEAALDGLPAALREVVSACLAKDPAARPTPAALAAAIADRYHGTGPSAVAFWPRPVASVIGAHQARLEQETKGSGGPAEEFSRASAAYPATTPAAGAASGWPAQPPLQSAGAAGAAGAQGYPGPQGYVNPQGYPQSQRYPSPQGHGPLQGYPQPQGYSGTQGSSGPPRGYAPNAQPVNYPQPYQVARAPLGPLPDSMRNAIGLMYAGAAYTLVYAIGVIIVAAAIISKHPAATATQAASGRVTVGGVVALTVFLSLIEIALWLGIARACRNGKSWARVTGTVLFGLHTLGFLGVLVNSHPGIGLTKVLTTLSWLIACGAVVFLWQRPSSAFFATASAPGRTT